jgi:hypothetical protein
VKQQQGCAEFAGKILKIFHLGMTKTLSQLRRENLSF